MIYQDPLAYLIGLEGIALLDAWAGDHDREFTETRLAEIRRLLDDEKLRDREPGVALDAACGTGRFAEFLAGRGHRVIGVDSSPDMLAHARRRVPDGEFHVAELDRPPLPDNSADVIVCALALVHVPRLQPVIAEFARVLRPGGDLVISDVHHELVTRGSVIKASGPGGEPYIAATYRHQLGDYLRAALSLGLQVRRCEEPTATGTGGPLPVPATEIGDWRYWPWSLMNCLPSAARAAGSCPLVSNPSLPWAGRDLNAVEGHREVTERRTGGGAQGLSTMRLMTGKRAETLLELMGQIEFFTLGRAWTGLTDDEFFWEPFTTSWSVRRQDECRTSNPFGAGKWVADFEIPEPAPVPMTTIAWLYWHMGSVPGRLCDIDFLGGTRTMASGWTSPYLTHHPIFTSAAEAVSALRDGWQRLRRSIERADDDQLEATTAGYTYAADSPRGGLCVIGPPGPAHPVTHFIAGALNEVSHHGTQIGALRDAYAWRRSTAVDRAT